MLYISNIFCPPQILQLAIMIYPLYGMVHPFSLRMKNSPRNLRAYCKLVTFRKIDLARDRGSAIVNTVLVYAALIFCHPEPTLQRKEKQDGISPHQRGFSKRGEFLQKREIRTGTIRSRRRFFTQVSICCITS